MLSILYSKKDKLKTALKAVYQAQTIVSRLDETKERNLDYVIVVNLLTSYFLLNVNRAAEALEFIELADNALQSLIKITKKKSIEVR
jgi:hypothetical protein